MRANKVQSIQRLILPTLGAISLLVIASSCKKNTEDASAKKIDENTAEVKTVETLKLIKIQKMMFPITIEVNGKVSIPDKDITNVTARVQGRIEAIPLQIGDRVKAGQTLGTIWSSDLITAVEEYKMAKTQNDEELINLSQQKLKAIGLSVGDAIPGKTSFPFRAPNDGVVLDKKLNAGSAINVGDLILTIGKNTALQFSAEVPPETALKIKPGMKVRFPDHLDSISALVSNVSPVADPATNLVKLRCQFESLPKGIPQESYLKAEVILNESESLVVPAKSLILTNEGERVFVQDEKNPLRFSRVPITIKSRNKIQLDVADTKDIHEGRMIVGDGALLLEGILEGEE